MLVAVLLFSVGLVCLIKGGDWFVDGATGIAHKFHVPELLIGATIVSIGTTLPEVMVSATSAVTGHGEIAYGNAIGSIICNTSLIAAITMAIRPCKVNRKAMIIPVAFFFGAAVFYSAIAYVAGYFGRIIGVILLLGFVAYIIVCSVREAKGLNEDDSENPEEEKEEEKEDEKPAPLWKNILFLLIGAVLIALGARLLIDNGTIIATKIGVPESVIALTFIALGTSLPELVTAITSLAKGHGSLSLGNIIGANLFNIVLVSGISTTLSPFGIPGEKMIAGMNASLVVDIPLMLSVMIIMTIPPLIRGKLERWQGILLLIIYAAYCVFQFIS